MRWREAPEFPLILWGGLLNGVWEFLHSPLYTDYARGLWYVIWTRLHCTVGDLMILLASFWITSLMARTRLWLRKPNLHAAALFFALGVGYTTYSEWHNTTVAKAWEYSPFMPVVLGIGLSPLLQWIIIPPVLTFLIHRRLAGAPRFKPTSPAK